MFLIKPKEKHLFVNHYKRSFKDHLLNKYTILISVHKCLTVLKKTSVVQYTRPFINSKLIWSKILLYISILKIQNNLK